MPQGRGTPAWVVAVVIGVVAGAIVGGGFLLLASDDEEDPKEPVVANDGSDDGGSDPTEAPATTVPSVEPGSTLTGTWEGTYQCAQGVTGLKLSIVDLGEGPLDAAFEFAPVPENPGVATGGYWMTGDLDDGALVLDGSAWFSDSGTYQMVGLEADTAEAGDTDQMEGTVVGDGCTTFSVERTSEDPWYVGKWVGKYVCAQGLTGITLDITETGVGTVEAVYDFYEVPENPGVPSGSYTLTGEYVDRTVTFEPEEWVEQPTGYVMVGITGNPDAGVGPTVYAGRVDDPSCQAFLLQKEGTAAPAG